MSRVAATALDSRRSAATPGVNAPGSGHSLVHLARHQPSARQETSSNSSTLAENPSLEEIPSLELLACLLFYLYFIMLGPEQL